MLRIKSIPAFNDNYIWLICNDENQCVVVDPGDAKPVIRYLTEHELTLNAILVTHHHNDHVGGISELVRHQPNLNIIGPKNDAVPGLTHTVEGGEQIDIFGERFMVLDLPGHTLGHIGYVGDGKLFCGDVLFSAGCGRVFEGTPEQMHQSLQKIMRLPAETEVYCAHEYTASNLAFAMAVEPNNKQLREYRDEVNRLRAANKSTIPTTLIKEKWVNPFLRVAEPEVMKSVNNRTSSTDELSVFTALREWKNEF